MDEQPDKLWQIKECYAKSMVCGNCIWWKVIRRDDTYEEHIGYCLALPPNARPYPQLGIHPITLESRVCRFFEPTEDFKKRN